MKRLLLFFLGLCCVAPAQAALYGTDNVTALTVANTYVDNTIGPANCATYTIATRACGAGALTAYKDLSDALAAAAVNDVLLVRAGTYTETAAMTLSTSGITLAAYNDEAVTVNGCVSINAATITLKDLTISNVANDLNCGGWKATVTVAANISNATIAYNHITGADSQNGAGVFVASNAATPTILGNFIIDPQGATSSTIRLLSLNGVVIDGNRLQNNSTVGQEVLQPSPSFTNQATCGAETIIRNNWFDTSFGENHFDMKATNNCNQTITFENNRFDAPESGTGTMIMAGTPPAGGKVITYNFRRNYFTPASGSRVMALSGQSGCTNALCGRFDGSFTNNIFVCDGGTTEAINVNDSIASGTLNIDHNTFIDCEMVLRGYDGTLRSNIFENPLWTNAETGTVTCSHNNIRGASGALDYTCSNGTTADPAFGGAADYNVTTASLLNSGHDGLTKGAHREISFVSATINNTAMVTTYSTQGTLPLSACTHTSYDVEYDAVDATENSCIPASPNTNTTTVVLSAAPGSGQTVTQKWVYGAVVDSFNIGGPEMGMHNKIKAQATPQAVTNQSTGQWQTGVNCVPPAGSDRLGVYILTQEKPPVAPPMVFSNVRIGGQAATQLATIDVPDGGVAQTNLLEVWYCKEACLAAQTGSVLTYDTSEVPVDTKPVLTACGYFTGVNQTTPFPATQSAIVNPGTSLSTAALTTENGGAAVMTAVAGTPGTYTTLGAGWNSQVVAGEDAGPDFTLLIADRATDGTNVTPAVTTYSVSSRLAMIGFSVASAAQPPAPSPSVATLTQTASRCFYHDLAGYVAQLGVPENSACRVVPGHHLAVVSQYKNTVTAETAQVGKRLQCCVGGTCTDPEHFWLVPNSSDNFATRDVNFAESSAYAEGEAISSRKLSDPTGTFVAGAIYNSNAVSPTLLASGEYRELGHVLHVNPALAAPTTVTCRLGLEDGTPLNGGYGNATTVISVVAGKGYGL